MGSQLTDELGVIEISNNNFGDREIVSNLTIIMADPSDAGGYACNATNAAGQDTAVGELTVHGKWFFVTSGVLQSCVIYVHYCLLSRTQHHLPCG